MNQDRPLPRNEEPKIRRDLDETWMALPRHLSSGTFALHGEESVAAKACLVVLAHPDPMLLGRCFPLSPDRSTLIGRQLDADICFSDLRQLSRQHARVTLTSAGPVVEDLGSKNGTFVNGLAVDGSCPLYDGDRILLPPVYFKFFRGRNIEQVYHQAIYELVVHDDLTGIFNRRRFDEELPRDFFRAMRHQRPLCLILFDIDGFKEINDHHGHACGDHVLRQVTDCLAEELRKEGLFARVGGDEFAVICPEATAEGGRALAERMLNRVRQHEFVYGGGDLSVTCSFGVAPIGAEVASPDALFAIADDMLYQSKAAGGDQVTCAS